MPLYNPQSPVAAAQAAMNGASQTAAAQTRQTTRTIKKDESFWDQFHKGATGVAALARGIGGLVDAAEDTYNLYDTVQQRDAYDLAAKTFQEGGFDALQSNQELQDYRGQQAIGKLMLDRAGSNKGRLEMMKNLEAVNDKLYQDWRIQAAMTQQAFNSGDMEQFMPAMQQLIEKAPLPYKLDPSGDGNFKVMFRSDAKGGWTDTGKSMTPEEAMAQVNDVMRGELMVLRGIGGKAEPTNPAFLAASARHQYATMVGNAQNRLDPKKQMPLYDNNGNHAGLGIIQNPLDDYSVGPRLLVFDKRGEQVGTFDGIDEAIRAGFSPHAGKGIGAGGKATGGGGAGGSGRFGPKGGGGGHISMLRAGYLWDDKQQWYFKNAGTDADGKPQVDYSQPASDELYSEALQRAGYAQGIGGTGGSGIGKYQDAEKAIQEEDAKKKQAASAPQRSASPNTPEQPAATQETEESPQTEAFPQIARYQDESGTVRWSLVEKDGKPQEITLREVRAFEYERRKSAEARARKEARERQKKRKVAVTIGKVRHELTPEEHALWKETGKLPSRDSQTR